MSSKAATPELKKYVESDKATTRPKYRTRDKHRILEAVRIKGEEGIYSFTINKDITALDCKERACGARTANSHSRRPHPQSVYTQDAESFQVIRTAFSPLWSIYFDYAYYHRYMDKRVFIQLNGDRKVTGVLRGFDPFMNLVLDEAVEETNPEKKNSIGMVVSTIGC